MYFAPERDLVKVFHNNFVVALAYTIGLRLTTFVFVPSIPLSAR
jgi:hypothetical protein